MRFKWYKIPFYVLLGLAIIAGLGYVTMALWNLVVPDLFNGPVIAFWQALGLLVLIRIFFHSWHRPYYRNWYGWYSRNHYWKQRLERKMAAMSSEDREKFREEWIRRCGSRFWDGRHHQHEEAPEETDKKE